jgi:Na+-transporting NADH:ubiquinone oxidoreductase subunit NqrC
VADIKNNDSIGKTLMVVLVLCLVCSIVVAGSACTAWHQILEPEHTDPGNDADKNGVKKL